METNKIHLEDCMETMKRFSDRSIDYCITSPPYNVSTIAFSNKTFGGVGKYKGYKDDMKDEDYFENQKKVISEMLRITKNHIFYNIQMVSGNKFALHQLMGHFHKNLKEVLIWSKTSDKFQGQPAISEKVFNSAFEYILVFSNSYPEKRLFEDANFKRGTQPNIFKIKNSHSNKFSDVHKAVFPLDLPRYFMQNFGNDGDIWYDHYMGTGTTGVGALLEKKKYIGSEIFNKYKELAENRLLPYLTQKTLF